MPARLATIATGAAQNLAGAIGRGRSAERFVLDDGWFGRRDDDSRSLSNWEVDPRKCLDGLTPLVEHVRGLGNRAHLVQLR
jgi:alpha-galactosidase